MKTVAIERTAYPQLPDHMSEQEVMEWYTLEPAELSLVVSYKGDQLGLAMRLKLFQQLLHHQVALQAIPLAVLTYVASQLQVLLSPLKETRNSKHRQIAVIRQYTHFSPFSSQEHEQLERWLMSVAQRYSNVVDLVNAAIFHLKEIRVELPAFQRLVQLAAQCLNQIEIQQRRLLTEGMSDEQKQTLDRLLDNECRYQLTPFYTLKEPPKKPTATAIIEEIELLQRLRGFGLSFDVLAQISNDKMRHFAEIAKSYKSNELADLAPEKRYAILLCFLYMRIKEVTDNILHLVLRLWARIKKKADSVQDEYLLKQAKMEQQREVLAEQLLNIIVESTSKDELADRIFELHTYEEYKVLLQQVQRCKRSKRTQYFETLSSKYSHIRKFSPLLWEHLTFRSNTSNIILIQAIDYLKLNLDPSVPELPVKGAPTEWVPEDWDRQVFIRQRGSRKILSIQKSMYEICLLDQLLKHLSTSDVYVQDSQYYCSLEDYLISPEEFHAKREYYVQQLHVPETADEFMNGVTTELEALLEQMNQNYDTLKTHTKIVRGSLSFTKAKRQDPPTEIEELTTLITERMTPVSIIDILTDVNRLTGFLDLFEPVGHQERMSAHEKAEHLIATLLCYAGNFSPQQIERSTGIKAASILYMRRRYLKEENLLKAIGFLADCQHTTWLSASYGDGTGFITDGSLYPAPKKSLYTEPHFRYGKGHGIISYPMVSDQYVALITQTITCSQYEAMQMLESLFKQKSHLPLSKNFSDSHGQSLLVFALARLLHIELYPRLRTRKHKMLYKICQDVYYDNLDKAIHGTVHKEWVRQYYDDMLRILASFSERKASPFQVLFKIASLSNTNRLKIALLELGKACRSIFLLKLGTKPELHDEIQRETLKVERWHRFGKDVFIGHGGKMQEDSLEEQSITLLTLNTVLNGISFWNTLAIQQIVQNLRAEGHAISQEELRYITPTMLEHIDLLGKFEINFDRQVPFEFDLNNVQKFQESSHEQNT